MENYWSLIIFYTVVTALAVINAIIGMLYDDEDDGDD